MSTLKSLGLGAVKLEPAGDRFCLQVECVTARYHVWGDIDKCALDFRPHDRHGITIYKNPQDMPRGRDRTRHLSADKGEGKIVYDYMMSDVQSLVGGALEALADNIEREKRQHRTAVIANRERAEAGSSLYLLREIVRTLDPVQHADVVDRAQAIINRVDAP